MVRVSEPVDFTYYDNDVSFVRKCLLWQGWSVNKTCLACNREVESTEFTYLSINEKLCFERHFDCSLSVGDGFDDSKLIDMVSIIR